MDDQTLVGAEPSPAATGHPAESAPGRSDFRYSIVVPVFNSEEIVGHTVEDIVDVFTTAGVRHEVILVNDGSRDRSWEVIAEKARVHDSVVALDLLRNSGQHRANLAGLRESTGDYVVTMDDDGQNPPEEALTLIDAALAGHDVVFGRFERKRAAGYRRLGSRLIGLVNRRVFGQPPDLAVSNFRVLRRDVVDRICASRTPYPYLTGQALLYSRRPVDVPVRHEPRRAGQSTYSLVRILRLVLTILFSYSVFPLRLAAAAGFAIAAVAFLVGCWFLVRGVLGVSVVPGWTSVIVLLALLNGVVIALLSMLGEYVVRTLVTVSDDTSYHVVNRVP